MKHFLVFIKTQNVYNLFCSSTLTRSLEERYFFSLRRKDTKQKELDEPFYYRYIGAWLV